MALQSNVGRVSPEAAMLANLSVDELLRTTQRLTDIMTEESELLKAMRVSELPRLQEEKLRLAGVLELYQEQLARDPGFVKQASDQTREDLLFMTDDLAFVVEENFRQVSAVKAVNARVMQAIMEVVSEQHRPSTYSRYGTAAVGNDLPLSMNLNQRA